MTHHLLSHRRGINLTCNGLAEQGVYHLLRETCVAELRGYFLRNLAVKDLLELGIGKTCEVPGVTRQRTLNGHPDSLHLLRGYGVLAEDERVVKRRPLPVHEVLKRTLHPHIASGKAVGFTVHTHGQVLGLRVLLGKG